MPKKKQKRLPVAKIDTLVQAAYNKGTIDGSREMAQRAMNIMAEYVAAKDGCLGLYAIGAAVEWWRLARDREPGGGW